jgi:hypothetical protein
MIGLWVIEFALLIFYYDFPENFGRVEAQFDLWQNRYEFRVCGSLFPPGRFEETLAYFGVKYRLVEGGQTIHAILRTTGYNLVVLEAIYRERIMPAITCPARNFKEILKEE